jgi:uncharacterized membrane protein
MNLNKKDRPIIPIELKTFDKILEAIALIIFISIWVTVIYFYDKLPQIIPVHFDLTGNVDRMGDKSSIFTLPFIASFLYLLITVISKYPQSFNYLQEITLDNAKSQYTFATRLLRVIKLIVLSVLFVIILVVIRS